MIGIQVPFVLMLLNVIYFSNENIIFVDFYMLGRNM